MNRQFSSDAYRRMQARRSKRLLILAGVVLFAGLFTQITMLARISAQNKQASSLEKQISELSASADNLELSINQYHNLDQIAARAQQLGMEQPDETQIRVVNVVRNIEENTSTQTAEGNGGTEILN